MTIIEQNTMNVLCSSLPSIARSLEAIAKRTDDVAAKDAEIAMLKHILKSACRWIKCHDIYHTSGADILKEAKEILHDDGEFLFKEADR